MIDYEERTVILWDLGGIEEFPTREDAQDELMAMESRGHRGTVYTDVQDAIRTYLSRELDQWKILDGRDPKDNLPPGAYGFLLGMVCDHILIVDEQDGQPVAVTYCRSAFGRCWMREFGAPIMEGDLSAIPEMVHKFKNRYANQNQGA